MQGEESRMCFRKTGRREMNYRIAILRSIMEKPERSQRELAEECGVSLGKINQELKACQEEGLLMLCRVQGRRQSFALTEKARTQLAPCRVERALLLASGFGSRFVPLSYETPKGLLPVFGERMIERQIRQLRERGIQDIVLMVGYLKEKFEYLIDKFGVELCYNPEYRTKNTLATLYHARKYLEGKNCYILSSDNWMRENLYHSFEPNAWYAASFMKGETGEWAISFSGSREIQKVTVGGRDQYCMYGPVYFSREFSDKFLPLIESYYRMPGTENYYWEDVLIRNLRHLPPIYINPQKDNVIYEFENLEELRLFDESYREQSGSEAMQLVARELRIAESEIRNIRCLKAGMTNRSWLFTVEDEEAVARLKARDFICRIPGKGTEKLINRREEAEIYRLIAPLGITEQLCYFDETTGYKISRYYENSRSADFTKEEELGACFALLKRLHGSGLRVSHSFSLSERISFYEGLCRENGGIPFEDYPECRQDAERLLRFTEKEHLPYCLCHIDPNHDNFLVTEEGGRLSEAIRMIDWEYAGMADPILDIAMAAIYAYRSFDDAKEMLRVYRELPAEERALDIQERNAGESERGGGVQSLSEEGRERKPREEALLVAYMGLGGLLWSLWGIYKSELGEEFGEYTLRMYRYFKDSVRILRKQGKC